MRRSSLQPVLFLAALVFLSLAGSATAGTGVHAHRGGSVTEGEPAYGENTLPALREAAKLGFRLEFDVKLTKDLIPVVFHDAELDRATTCTGGIAARTLAQLRPCKVDILGTEASFRQLPPGDARRAAIPTLRNVLAMMATTRARANIEIKNQPTDPDFDSSKRFARVICKEIRRSSVRRRRVIVQSFFPANLTVAQHILVNAETSFLTLGFLNSAGIDVASGNDFEWVSPEWPVDQDYVMRAHEAGLKIVPFTIDKPSEMRAARALGVEALITNDPTRARRVLSQPAARAALR